MSDRSHPTEERRALTAEHRLQLLIESVRDYAIFMLDPDGKIATWNLGAELIKGYTAAEVMGSSIERFYTPEDQAAGRPEALLRTARELGRVEDEGWRVRRDGTRFWADVVITAVRNGHDLLGYVKVTRDLTERRAAELARLELAHTQEALRMREDFLSIASHELRTPLVALQLQLDSLRMQSGLDAKQHAKLERATRNTQRLADLLNVLLDVSRISAGKLTLSPKPIDLGKLIAEVVDRLHEPAQQAGCKVTCDVENNVVGAWDALRIGQVISNVLMNSFKYAAGTNVDVALAREGDVAVLHMRDRGPGIVESHLEVVFGRFERASSSRNFGGLGLGLYVAREIVIAHGGTIEARNAEGGGAMLEIRLPVR